MNKTVIYSSVGLVIACSIAYMIYKGSESDPAVVVNDFNKDDQRVYDTMRNDLMTYVTKIEKVYGGWVDDLIRKEYEAGANINGRKSKSAALLAVINNGNYTQKLSWYSYLVNNLKEKYK